MEVTIFKKLRETTAPFHRDVFAILERIREGRSKELVDLIRSQPTKELSDKFKNELPAICFGGKFNTRKDSELIESSGLATLDFDKYQSIELLNEALESIKNDKYTFAAFISPSGNGIKVLVKIPKEPENYKKYFEALADHFDSSNFDISTSNISRVCFESYDPNIYINKDSEIFTTKIDEPELNYRNNAPTVKLENESEIIQRLYTWFNKQHSMTEGQRNANLFILASAFSDYGISDIETKRFCYQFEAKDFTRNEIDRTIKSAYSKGKSNFGMKFFEDSVKLQEIKKEIKSGTPIKEIKEKFPTADEESLKTIKQDVTSNDFWTHTKKGVKIENYEYKRWLEGNGFFKYYPEGSESFIFVKVTNNLIDNTNEVKIKDFVLSELLKNEELQVYEYMAGTPKYFKDDYLNILDESNIFFKEDTIDKGYIYFKNVAVEVYKDGARLIDYLELDGFVWKKHIIDFDFKPLELESCDFSKFVNLVSSNDPERVNALTSTIGYLMHSFKTSANNKAVILNDETISENPNGGSGKGIFWNALSRVKRVSDINGKSFSFEKSFPYQTVSADTQILVFDDVQKNFKFENLFSVITEGITLEKKNKDAIKIPVSKSPKIVITTNYTLGGVGGSFERRKWELEFSSYFSSTHTPLNEFGRMLFDEWDNTEWQRFYNYMISCLQMYLNTGLVTHGFKNLDTRKLIKETHFEFYEWVEDSETIAFGERLNKTTIFTNFIEEYPDFKKWLTQRKFWQWIDIYCKFKGYETNKGRSFDGRWIEITRQNIL
jgi:hypothetical protein